MELLTKKETAKEVKVHPEHLMRMVRQGRFPKPVRLGASQNCPVRWDRVDIDTYLAELKVART